MGEAVKTSIREIKNEVYLRQLFQFINKSCERKPSGDVCYEAVYGSGMKTTIE